MHTNTVTDTHNFHTTTSSLAHAERHTQKLNDGGEERLVWASNPSQRACKSTDPRGVSDKTPWKRNANREEERKTKFSKKDRILKADRSKLDGKHFYKVGIRRIMIYHDADPQSERQ